MQKEGPKLEEEIKLPVRDIPAMLNKIRAIAKYVRTEYIRDVVYGIKDDKKKIRLRIQDDFASQTIDATHKHRLSVEEGIRREMEEVLYRGDSWEDALKAISTHGDFAEENSYEKTRVIFVGPHDTEITLDVYPYGAWLEIEATEDRIWEVAALLGFKKEDAIVENADELYDAWCRKNKIDILWDVRFGFPDMDDNIYEKANKGLS